MNKLPRKKDLTFKWTVKEEDCKPWELLCEKSFQEYETLNPQFKNIPFRAMHFKSIWVKSLSQYCK